MYSDKTQYETSLDLGLYIEGLLNTEDTVPILKTDVEEDLQTIILNDLLVAEEVNTLETKSELTETQSHIPEWGKEPFKCLQVKSAGMSVMIPAMSIAYVEQINKKIIRLPLEVEAFRGVLTLRNRSVAIIDLFSLISENSVLTDKSLKRVDEHHIKHVIVMDDGAYALACDEIGEMLTMQTENVRWNQASFNNPMFSGIVPDYLCPIVNIDNVQQQVSEMSFVQSLNSKY
jgi:purine-binding chemotaxis protein CheW